MVAYEDSDVCKGGCVPATAGAGLGEGAALGSLLLGVFIFGIVVGAGLQWWCCRPRSKVRGDPAPRVEPQASATASSSTFGTTRSSASRLADSLRLGAKRTVATQSQVVYQWWKSEPRFQPLPDRSHGAWSD